MDINAYNKWLGQEYEKTKSIEILGRYVVSETIPPIGDNENAVKIVRENYKSQTNSTLLIIGAYLASEWTVGNNELLDILNKMHESLSEKEKSIVFFLNAHYLRFRDDKYVENPEYQKNLLESIKNKEPFVNNRIFLAELYTEEKAKKIYEDALADIVKIYTDKDIEGMTVEQLVEPQTFINEHILGTHISYATYEVLRQRSQSIDKKIMSSEV